MGMRRGGVGTRRFYLVGKGVTKVLRCCGGDKVVMEVLSKVELILLLSYLLKIGEYSCGVLMNKQYFQVQDYALWEVIENVSTMMLNNVCAIETRFGGNEATKKTQKTLLKQQYENFSTSSTESIDSIFNRLQKIFEKVKQEKEGIEFKIEKFDKASKDLDKLLGSQITDKSKKGLGYNVVPPPHPLIYNRPKKLDLSYSGLDEFKDPEFKSYGSEDSKQESNIVCDKKSDASKENSDDSLVKEQVSEDTSSFVESSLNVDKETVFLVDKKIEFVKPKNHEKPVKKLIVNTIKGKGWQMLLRHQHVRFGDLPNLIGKPQQDDTGFIDSGCSRYMIGNIAYLSDFKEFDGGYVTFGRGAHGGRNSNVWLKELCPFTDTECLVLSPNFKLADESQILLKIPRKDNMYNFDMKNIVPKESLTCFVAKATSDESMLWHRRLSHINFKNKNKLVKDNLVRGLPTKRFENNQTCVACLKGKQHIASCKSKVLNPITKPLFMLHMDFFGPTFVSSLMHKKYCLVVTNDYRRFTWVFFLTTKNETSEILKNFIKEIENLVDKKVKIIISDNGTEFKNKVMDDFCREKRVLVVKPHNKTSYELFRGSKPVLSFMRPFGCHVTILNTLDSLGKFDVKSDEGFFVGYSLIWKEGILR
ncbi:putative ribonuclease H-like domain-containing protein [Tanacetum coccineum]